MERADGQPPLSRADKPQANACLHAMNPNLTALLVLLGLVLSLFAGELFRYVVGMIPKSNRRKCREHCGGLGWTVARKDAESCHALCIKCGWMSHFDIKHWQELNKR